jgi:predicted amidohydrolase
VAKGVLRIGLAQMDCVVGDVEANLDHAGDFIDEALAHEVDLLVFPELALSGYAVGDGFSDAGLDVDGPQANRLRELSKQLPLIMGFIEETEDVSFFNSAAYLSEGEVRDVHRKVYLPNYRIFEERRFFGAGWNVRAFDTRWARMGMLICDDAWHLTLPYLAVHAGADVLLILAASSREGLAPNIPCDDAWERMNRSYALTLSTFIVFVNRVGQEGGLTFWGGSHVVGPDGNFLGKAPLDQEHLLVVDLDFAALRQQRLILPFRRDDSLGLTVDLGSRILRANAHRRDGFLGQLRRERKHPAPYLNGAAPMTAQALPTPPVDPNDDPDPPTT